MKFEAWEYLEKTYNTELHHLIAHCPEKFDPIFRVFQDIIKNGRALAIMQLGKQHESTTSN